jgi:gas vesicle protein
MAHDNNNMVKGLVIGLLAGSAIGALLALLYAPKSGKELRSDIKAKAEDLVEDAEGYVQSAREKSGQIISEAKRRSEELITDAKRKATSLLEDADKILSNARQKTGAVVQEGARLKGAVKAGVEAFKDERNR